MGLKENDKYQVLVRLQTVRTLMHCWGFKMEQPFEQVAKSYKKENILRQMQLKPTGDTRTQLQNW